MHGLGFPQRPTRCPRNRFNGCLVIAAWCLSGQAWWITVALHQGNGSFRGWSQVFPGMYQGMGQTSQPLPRRRTATPDSCGVTLENGRGVPQGSNNRDSVHWFSAEHTGLWVVRLRSCSRCAVLGNAANGCLFSIALSKVGAFSNRRGSPSLIVVTDPGNQCGPRADVAMTNLVR